MAQNFEWSVIELIETLKKTAEVDKDNLIPIDGTTGSGKSTLGIKMCVKACPWFDMEKDILFSRKELIDWVTTARPGSWCLADEAVNMLFKRDFASKDQKFLLRILDMCRDRNLTVLMCIPNFWALDRHVLEGRVRLRIHIAKTGIAFMWKPDPNPFAQDKWYRKYNEKVCYNWSEHYNARRTKGFVGYLRFGDLAEKYKTPYLDIKKRKKEEIKLQEEEEEKQKSLVNKKVAYNTKTMLLDFLDRSGFLHKGWRKAYAMEEGVTPEAISHRLKDYRDKLGNLSEQNEKLNKYSNSTNNDNFDGGSV